MKAKQENIVKEREKKLAQKQAEKEREKQRQLEAKLAEKNKQKKQVCFVVTFVTMQIKNKVWQLYCRFRHYHLTWMKMKRKTMKILI